MIDLSIKKLLMDIPVESEHKSKFKNLIKMVELFDEATESGEEYEEEKRLIDEADKGNDDDNDDENTDNSSDDELDYEESSNLSSLEIVYSRIKLIDELHNDRNKKRI